MTALPPCPTCGTDHRTYIRARGGVWFICHAHKLRWGPIDYWLPSWTDKPERGPLPLDWSDDQIWDYREQMLREYAVVKHSTVLGTRASSATSTRCRNESTRQADEDERTIERIEAQMHERYQQGLADYDATDDFSRSIDARYAAIRERVAAGGEGWRPK